MSARAVDAKGDGAIVDDRWTCQAQEWDYTWWHAAWETFARSCRADEPLATIAVEECARSRSTAARLIIVRLLEGTDREHVLAPLLGGRTVAGVREELQRSIPPAPPKRRVSSGFDETYAPLDLSEPLRRLFDLGDESHPGSIANVVGDLVVRDGREPQRDGLVNLLASWSNDASIEVQRGRRIFIEGCMEAASRVPAGQLDLEGYAAVSRALWEAWRHIDGQAKHLGFQPEIGWRLSSVPPSARIVLEKALAPLIDAILVDGDGEDLRGLDMDSYWDLLDRQTVARIVAELIRRVTDGVPAARSRVRAFEIAVQRFIDGMLGSGVLDSAQVDSLLSLVHRNRWLLDTPRLHRHLIERARELRRS